MVDKTPFNQQVDRVSGVPRAKSAAEEAIDQQSDYAEDVLGQKSEVYRNQARRQRVIAQRMRRLSEISEDGSLRGPRNAQLQGKQQPKTKLDRVDFAILFSVALLFDIIGGIISLLDFLLPPVGELINSITVFPIATFTLYLMYKKRGIEFKEGKVLVRFWGSLLIGFIPVLSVFPEYALNVILIYAATKAEEKLKV